MKVAQLCPTFCDPMDCRVPGILQARILKWVAFPFSRGASQPRDWTQVSCIAGGFFTSWATGEPKVQLKHNKCLPLVDCHKGTEMIWSLLSMRDKHWEGHGGDLLPLQASSHYLHETKWKLYNEGSVITPQFVFSHTLFDQLGLMCLVNSYLNLYLFLPNYG